MFARSACLLNARCLCTTALSDSRTQEPHPAGACCNCQCGPCCGPCCHCTFRAVVGCMVAPGVHRLSVQYPKHLFCGSCAPVYPPCCAPLSAVHLSTSVCFAPVYPCLLCPCVLCIYCLSTACVLTGLFWHCLNWKGRPPGCSTVPECAEEASAFLELPGSINYCCPSHVSRFLVFFFFFSWPDGTAAHLL